MTYIMHIPCIHTVNQPLFMMTLFRHSLAVNWFMMTNFSQVNFLLLLQSYEKGLFAARYFCGDWALVKPRKFFSLTNKSWFSDSS